MDLVLIGVPWTLGGRRRALSARIAAVQARPRDRRAELLVAGRTSASTLAWLERHTASRTRALIEERGLRAGATANQRPTASVLGALLDRDGPESFGDHVARLADAAIVDTRVLFAHRLGADETLWPDGRGPVRLRSPAPDRISIPGFGP